MIKYIVKKVITVHDWNELVQKTYNRPYNFQQQDGCQERGMFQITIPSDDNDDLMYDEIPEEVNGNMMGVKFKTWLQRDPKKLLAENEGTSKFDLELFWQRNFYPDIQKVANDLYLKGLVEAGDYYIKIDW